MGDLKFKNVFVTGGAGYVGSTLVPHLLNKGYNVTVYDLYIYGDTLEENGNLKQIKGDIRDRDRLVESVCGADALIHLACISNDPSFDLDPQLGKSINFDAFSNVLDATKINNVKRFILASSTSQYGVKPLDVKVTEETPAEPITDYARYKIECESLMQSSDLGDMEYVFVRPATLCGYAPRMRLDLTVNILTMHALVNKRIKIFGGEQLRPSLNINDMARFYELMLNAPEELINRQAFNITHVNYSVRRYAELVKETLNDEKIEFEVVPTDDKRSYHVDDTKIRERLGFQNDFTIEDAILSIKQAYEEGKIIDGLNNPIYHNIKQMKNIRLK